jgi:hypothetical protein
VAVDDGRRTKNAKSAGHVRIGLGLRAEEGGDEEKNWEAHASNLRVGAGPGTRACNGFANRMSPGRAGRDIGAMRFLLLALLPGVLAAQATPVTTSVARAPLTTSRALRTTAAIRIDGKLDDAPWRSAPVTSDFIQIDPEEGKPSSQRTEVRVIYDDEALYVGVRAFDTGRVVGRLGRRDMALGDSDWLGVMIDSYHDHRTAFGFDVNPAGVQRDETKTINTDDGSWDAVWTVGTSIDSAGWTAEYRIPFSQLRFSPDSVQTWGVQFERLIGRRNEYSVSTYIPKKERGGVPMYGHLEGIERIPAGTRLEVLPYTLGRAEYVDPRTNPYRGKREYFNSVGLDVRYRAASNLTLNATFNPDFGQVEVDPAVVNLGVYETFFAEKRPFFLEGNEIFDFGLGGTSGGQLFYSRRIGRPPTLAAPTSRSDMPPTTTILGAGKLSGKIAGWSVGTLAAVTDLEEARFLDAQLVDQRRAAEPRSAYLVSRARRELRGGQSLVGGVLTLVHRDLGDSLLRATFRSGAMTAGVDFRHEWGNRRWAVRGDAALNRIAGDPLALIAVQRSSTHYFQRPDALHLEVDSSATSLVGYSMSANLTKLGGEHWRGDLAAALTSPQYEVNDIGFAVRTDRRDVQGSVTYLQNTPGKILRRWSSNTSVRSEHNYAGEPILTLVASSVSTQTVKYWNFNASVQRQFRSFDDRLTRGGPIAARPAQVNGSVSMSTDGRKPITGDARMSGSRGDQGIWSWTTGMGVGVKTSGRWNLRVGPTFTRAFAPAQYVTSAADASYTPTYGRRYVFAPIAISELGLETRFNVTVTPRLSFESYMQPLLSSGDYGFAKQLVAARTFDFVPYTGAIPNLDFNVRSLRGNAVLRWEWRPGSTLFVAWQQSRSNAGTLGNFELSRDGRALQATRPDNIILVKLNWWMTP